MDTGDTPRAVVQEATLITCKNISADDHVEYALAA
jgi:hypothetical protein